MGKTARLRRIGFLGVVLLAAVWTLASRVSPGAGNAAARPPSPHEGFGAPEFTLETIDGKPVSLSDLRGSVVLLNFWASWCLPCKVEMPAIEQVHRAYSDLGVAVLAVNATDQDLVSEAADFVSENNLTFPIPLDRDGAVMRSYQVRGLPTTFFIDREGIIREVVVGGPMSEALLQSKVEELLAEGR